MDRTEVLDSLSLYLFGLAP